MTDKQLYSLCKKYGRRALEARRKFAGLLPEVQKRESLSHEKARICGGGKSWLEKRGYGGVYEFAARLGGLSRDQVDEVLRLEKRFEAVPVLRQALVEGEVSASKLARVAVVATAENASEVLGLAKNLSYAALNIKVREIKIANGFCQPQIASTSLCAQTLEELGISEEVAEKLHDMKRKGMDVNRLLLELLEKREKELSAEELRIEERVERGLKDRSRNVPVAVKRLLMQKFGNECAAPGCEKRALQLHHVREYALGGSHSPGNLRPLCRGHHELEHVGTRVAGAG